MSWAISDIHLSPGMRWTLDMRDKGPLVIDGDTFNLLPYGLKEWETPEGMATVQSVVDLTQDAVWISGNHDPLNWLRPLLVRAGVGPSRVVRSLDVDGHHFEHGHRFAGDWAILRYIAPSVVEWLTTNPLTRKWWYQFCVDRGWIASDFPHSSERYDRFVSVTWGFASLDADRNHRTNVIGHTHCRASWDNLIDLGSNELVEVI